MSRDDPAGAAARSGRPAWLILVLGLVGVGAVSGPVLDRLPIPVAWIASLWGLVLLCFAALWPGRALRRIAIALGVLAAGLGLSEAALGLSCPVACSELEPNHPDPWSPDDVLGYAPPASHHWVHRRFRAGQLLFSAEITTGPDRLRIVPRAADGAEGSILFFGGSFTFGGAVNDDETLPWQVGLLVERRFQVHSFSFDGYGPHQMLAAIEAGRVAEVVKRPPRIAVYQLITNHPLRAAGRVIWDRHGPRYVLEPGGGVVRRGSFDTRLWSWQHLVEPLVPLLDVSQLAQRWLGRSPQASQDEIELTAAILARSRDLLRAQWPDLELHVVLWPWQEPATRNLRAAVERRGLEVHLVPEMLPPSQSIGDDYLVPGDGHPNARCYREMALALVERLVGTAPGSAPPGPGRP